MAVDEVIHDQPVSLTAYEQRRRALAGIAVRLAAGDPPNPALIDQALAVAGTIPADEQRSEALAGIARQLAVVDPARAAALIDEALAVAGTIPYDGSHALAGLAERLAVIDPEDPALIDLARAVAGTVPTDWDRSSRAGRHRSAAGCRRPGPGRHADRPGLGRGQDHPLRQAAQRGADRHRRAAGCCRPGAGPALIDQALAVAGAIPDDEQRSDALAAIAGGWTSSTPLKPCR